jgi:hypothetical protein
MRTPFFYPADQPHPQQLVRQSRMIATFAIIGGESFSDAAAGLAGQWSPGSLGDWKNIRRRGLYDSTANYMLGATSAAQSVPFLAIKFAGDADHWRAGGNSTVNNSALWSGYSAIGNGATLQLVPYTLTW